MAGLSPPQLSVIIVSFNVKELILKCLDSIFLYLKFPLEVIVVDNRSTDGTQDAIQTKYKQVKFIGNSDNKGFSAANNQGAELACGSKILFLNPDTELTDDSLSGFLDYLSDNPLDIIAPRLLNSDHSIQNSCWSTPHVSDIFCEAFFLDKLIPRQDYSLNEMNKRIAVDCVSGAAIMTNREFFRNIGFFDNNLFWMEDIDLCYRVHKAGGHVMYEPQARVIHLVGQSSMTNNNIAISNQLISKIKFFRKNYSAIQYIPVNLFIFIHIASRIMILLTITPFNDKFRVKLRAYLYSLKKYLRYNFLGDMGLI